MRSRVAVAISALAAGLVSTGDADEITRDEAHALELADPKPAASRAAYEARSFSRGTDTAALCLALRLRGMLDQRRAPGGGDLEAYYVRTPRGAAALARYLERHPVVREERDEPEEPAEEREAPKLLHVGTAGQDVDEKPEHEHEQRHEEGGDRRHPEACREPAARASEPDGGERG